MAELARFAAESIWNLFVVLTLFCVAGAFLVGALSALGRSCAAVACSVGVAVASIKEKTQKEVNSGG